jgi:hypothetical protein
VAAATLDEGTGGRSHTASAAAATTAVTTPVTTSAPKASLGAGGGASCHATVQPLNVRE